jgi:hypothetical protein
MITVAKRDALGMSMGWMRQLYLKDSCLLGSQIYTRPKLQWSAYVTDELANVGVRNRRMRGGQLLTKTRYS